MNGMLVFRSVEKVCIKQGQTVFFLSYKTSQIFLNAISHLESEKERRKEEGDRKKRGEKMNGKSSNGLAWPSSIMWTESIQWVSAMQCVILEIPHQLHFQRRKECTSSPGGSAHSSAVWMRQRSCTPELEWRAIWSILYAQLQQALQKVGDMGRAPRNVQGAADYSICIWRVLGEHLFASSKVN